MPFISIEAVESLITNAGALSEALMLCGAREVPVDANLLKTITGVIQAVIDARLTAKVNLPHRNDTADEPGDTTHPHESPLVDEPGDVPKFSRQRVPRSPLQGPRRDKQRVPFDGGKHLCKKHKPTAKRRQDVVKYWFFNAVIHSCQDCVAFCVKEHGVDIDVVSDNKEYTAQAYAKYNKDAEMLHFLQMLPQNV